jgi:hypothetical protein
MSTQNSDQDQLKKLVSVLNPRNSSEESGVFLVLHTKHHFKTEEERFLFVTVLSKEGQLLTLTVYSKSYEDFEHLRTELYAGGQIRVSSCFVHNGRFLKLRAKATISIEDPVADPQVGYTGPKQVTLSTLPDGPAMTQHVRVGSIEEPLNQPTIICSFCRAKALNGHDDCQKCGRFGLTVKISVTTILVDDQGGTLKAILAFDRLLDLLRMSLSDMIQMLVDDPDGAFIKEWFEREGMYTEYICLLTPLPPLNNSRDPKEKVSNITKIWEVSDYPFRAPKRRRGGK